MEFIKLLSGDTEIIKYSENAENFIMVSEQLQSEGFTVQADNSRFRHVFCNGQSGARLYTQAPCEGEYYLGLQIHDTFGTYDEEFIPVIDEECMPFSERLVELIVNDRSIGTFRFGGDDKKYYNFFTKNPVQLKKGENICYKVRKGNKALFTAIMLLKEKPEEQVNEILNITTSNGQVRFWTRLASKVHIILGQQVFTESQYLNNHRFQIPEEYWGMRFIIEAIDEQGNIIRGRGTCHTNKLRVSLPERNEAALTAGVTLKVALKTYQNPILDIEANEELSYRECILPVNSVLPLEKGLIFTEENICITDDQENRYITDCKVTSRWEDHSLRTVALSAILPVDGRSYFVENINSNAIDKPSNVEMIEFNAVQMHDGVRVINDGKEYCFFNESIFILPDREMVAVLYDKDEKRFVASQGTYVILEKGQNHIVVSRTNHFRNGTEKHMKCITNIHFYRNFAGYSLEIGFENDLMEQEHTVISGIYLEEESCREIVEAKQFATYQLDEDTVIEKNVKKSLRHSGRFEVQGQSIIVQDFWQNYPKFLSLSNDGLRIGICPFIFCPEQYQHEDIKLESRLFFYLKTGKYEFHCGLQKFHTIIFGKDAEQLANILFFPPESNVVEESGAFGHIKCNCPDFPKYDEYMSDSLKLFMEHREKYREYGMLNYGDSYGERQIHWTNQEYDFTYGMLIHFLRTGNYQFYELAKSSAAHYAEVDNSHKNIHFEENGYFFI